MFQPNPSAARHQTKGSLTASSAGTTVTSGSANSKGSWTSLGSFDFDCEAFTLQFKNIAAAGLICDIGLNDGSGNYAVIVENYRLCAPHGSSGNKGTPHNFTFPIKIPSGIQAGIRTLAVGSSNNGKFSLTGHSVGINGAPGYSRAIALYTQSSARGVTIDPGATVNTKGSWTQLIASTPVDIAGIFGNIGGAGDSTRSAAASMLFDIGVGAGGSEQIIYPDGQVCWSTNWDAPFATPRIYPFAVSIPAGSRIAARSQCSINTTGDRLIDLCLQGLVP